MFACGYKFLSSHIQLNISLVRCTHSWDVELGVLKAKLLEEKYEPKLEFPGGGVRGGGGGGKQKAFHGGSMDIFWNYTLYQTNLVTSLFFWRC